jgi:hypothetical protein
MDSSPLTEKTPGNPLPDLVSGSHHILHNGTALVAEDPLTVVISLPQWAYAIQFPLNPAVIARRSADKPYVVQLELLVAQGMVGVAGCNANGSAFTTPEIFASGQSLVRLSVDNPLETNAIMIRKASPDPHDIRVVIDDIAAFEPEKERLVPRRHDLDYDLFVILSAAKTGTQTIESTLNAISPFLRIHRLHYASAQGTTRLRTLASAAADLLGNEHEEVRSMNYQANVGDRVRGEIDVVRRLGGRVAFLTAVRDPIGRAVAALFQRLPTIIPVYPLLRNLEAPFFELLAAGLVATWSRELGEAIPSSLPGLFWPSCLADVGYFADEFRAVSGVDLLSHSFDCAAGFVSIEQGPDVALVLRTSDLSRSLPTVLQRITGRSVVPVSDQNVATEKPYSALYKQFLSRLQVPVDLVRAIYRRHDYLGHFIPESDITAYVERWSASRPDAIRLQPSRP